MGLGSLFKRNKKEKKEEVVEDSHIEINTDALSHVPTMY